MANSSNSQSALLDWLETLLSKREDICEFAERCLQRRNLRIQGVQAAYSSDRRKRAVNLLTAFEKLQEDDVSCDFEVRFGGEIFRAHRLILAASSDYFRAMLHHDTKESQDGFVDIKGLETSAVKACMHYIYSGYIENRDFENVKPLLKASDLMQISELKETLLDRILDNHMNVKKCFAIRHYGLTYHSTKVVKHAEDFIKDNLNEIIKTEGWQDLSATDVEIFLTAVKKKPTDVLWSAISIWVDNDKSKRSEYLPGLLRIILPLDLNTTLSKIVLDPIILGEKNCRDLIMQNVILPNSRKIPGLITESNCFQLKILARHSSDVTLSCQVDGFMSENMKFIKESSKCGELDFEDMKSLIEKGKKDSEETKFEIVVKWTESRPGRTIRFTELFRLLDLAAMSVDFIEKTILEEPIVQTCTGCIKIIMSALVARARKKR